MRARPRGISISEVLVASSLFLVVMLIGLGALQVVKRAGAQLKGRSQPRQQLRALVGHLQREVRAATFVFDPHETLGFSGGHSHVFEGAPPTDPSAPAAHEVLYAQAESAATEPSYTLQALFLEPDGNRGPFDGSHHVVWAKVTGMTGPTPGSPADIPLLDLPADRTEVRTFATASPGDGFSVRRTSTGDGLLLEFVVSHKTEAEKLHAEIYQAQLTMRNNR